jgi:hypothetical protein
MKEDIVDAGWTAQELSLIGSAELDSPPEGAADRTLAALGIGAAVGASSAVVAVGATRAGAFTSKASGAWLKWLSAALVGGGAVGATIVALSGPRAPSPSSQRAVPNALPSNLPPAERLEEPATASPAVAPSPTAAASTAVTAAPAQPSAERVTSKRPLSDEIRVIDEARRLLRQGNARGALAELTRYDAMVHGRGSMTAEATVVRIEALQAGGDRAGATLLGQRFVSQNPRSPYVAYVRRILALPD